MIATSEYELLTEDAGVVERPGRAVLLLEGGEAAEFLQGQVTNDVEALAPGEGCYAALLDHKGKLRADMRVLRLGPEALQVDGEAIAREVLRHNFETYSLGRDVRADRPHRRAHGLLGDRPGRARAARASTCRRRSTRSWRASSASTWPPTSAWT